MKYESVMESAKLKTVLKEEAVNKSVKTENRNYRLTTLTHFRPIFPLYTRWKYHKTTGFPMFSEDIKKEYWPEMA